MPVPTLTECMFAQMSEIEREALTQAWLKVATNDDSVVWDYFVTREQNIRFEKP